MIEKYHNLESTVNMFVILLLSSLNYFTDWLYVLPEFTLPLKYGKTSEEARADFTVLDIVSFFRMCIIEDKNYDNEFRNSTPQLIAECIAAY